MNDSYRSLAALGADLQHELTLLRWPGGPLFRRVVRGWPGSDEALRRQLASPPATPLALWLAGGATYGSGADMGRRTLRFEVYVTNGAPEPGLQLEDLAQAIVERFLPPPGAAARYRFLQGTVWLPVEQIPLAFGNEVHAVRITLHAITFRDVAE